jgi:hypothetical protein
MDEARQNAELLISSVRAALAAGTQHFDKAGKKLMTVKEVIVCLRDEGMVMLRMPDGVERALHND